MKYKYKKYFMTKKQKEKHIKDRSSELIGTLNGLILGLSLAKSITDIMIEEAPKDDKEEG